MRIASKHGTEARYRSGCKCLECRQAHGANNKRWKRLRAERNYVAQERSVRVERLMSLAQIVQPRLYV